MSIRAIARSGARGHRFLALTLMVLSFAAPARAEQQLAVWTGGGETNVWSNPFNWNDDISPDNGPVNTFNVLISSGVAAPLLDISVTIDKLTVLPQNMLVFEDGADLRVIGGYDGEPGNVGVLSNEGLLRMESAGLLTDLVITGNEFLLLTNASGNPGAIEMSANLNNRIYGDLGNQILFIDESQRILGAGQLGMNTLDIDNHGLISGTHETVPLIVDPIDAAPVFNYGTLQGDNGGVLQLNQGVYENVTDGVTGVINAGPDASVWLNGGVTIQHSMLSGVPSGEYRVIGNTVTLHDTVLGQAALTVPNDMDPRLQDAFIFTTSSGAIYLESSGNNTDLFLDAVDTDGVQFTGGGTIHMSDNTNNRIRGWEGGETLTNADCTIRGSGQIGLNVLTIINAGEVIADQAASLTLDPGVGGWTNDGIIRARNSATLRFNSGTYENAGGAIEAFENALVEFAGCTIVGGELRGTQNDSGLYRVVSDTVTFDKVIFTSSTTTLEVPNDRDPRFIDGIVNTGSIDMLSTGNNTDFYVDNSDTDGVQLSGGGTINFSNDLNNRIRAYNGGEVLTNINNLIRGSGQIGLNDIGIVNQSNGVIQADQSTRLQIDPDGQGLTNQGLIRAASGGTLRLLAGQFDFTTGALDAIDGSTLEFYGADASFGGNTLNLVGPCMVNLNGAFALRDVSIVSDPGTMFQVSGLTGKLENVTFDAQMTQQNDADVRWSDAIVNTGEITIHSTGNNTDVRIDAGDTDGAQLSGAGTIHLSNHANNRFNAWSGSPVLENVDNTIRGSGQIGANSISIVNGPDGTIIADQSTPLVIDPNSGGCLNLGLLRAEGDGVLQVNGGLYNQVGQGGTDDQGRIEAIGGGRVDFNGAHVRGGVLSADDGTVLRVTSNLVTLEDLRLSGTLEVLNDRDPRLRDGIVNEGVISLLSTGNNTDLVIDNAATSGVQLSGGGTIEMSDSANNRIIAWNGGEMLLNIDNTIRGAGRIGNNLTFVNDAAGTLIADQPTPLEFDVASAAWENRGTVIVEAGSEIHSVDSIRQTGGLFQVIGLLDIGAQTLEVEGGTVTLADRVVAAEVNNIGGVIEPGIDIGEGLIVGDYLQSNGGELLVELSGYVPAAEHDVLTVDGLATLAGTLRFAFNDAFVPLEGTAFTVLTADDIVGAFDAIEGPTQAELLYGLHTVTLVIGPGYAPGDCDGDGDVTIDDFSLFSQCETGANGGPIQFDCECADLDDDADVDLIDWGLFQRL